MTKPKRIDLLEQIPESLEKITKLIDNEIEKLADKDNLTPEDRENLLMYCRALTGIYKEHTLIVSAIKNEMKELSKADLLNVLQKRA